MYCTDACRQKADRLRRKGLWPESGSDAATRQAYADDGIWIPPRTS